MPDRPRTARLPPLDSSYRYPHELLELLVDTLPRLVRSKTRLIDFFEDAGTPAELLAGWRARVEADRQGVNKYHITRSVLRALNELEDRARPVRREILRRIATSKDFSACWDDDREKARTLVGWVREVASDKDARTWGDSLEEAFRRRQAIANYERRLRSVESGAAGPGGAEARRLSRLRPPRESPRPGPRRGPPAPLRALRNPRPRAVRHHTGRRVRPRRLRGADLSRRAEVAGRARRRPGDRRTLREGLQQARARGSLHLRLGVHPGGDRRVRPRPRGANVPALRARGTDRGPRRGQRT